MAQKRLREHADGLWTADARVDRGMTKFFRKHDFSTRMTVIRLSDGGLFIHSPVRLDDQDLFRLSVDGTRTRERIDGTWHSIRTVTESINVRDADEPELLKVRVSKLGPVIADDGRTVLALSWTGHYGTSPISAFLRMNRASSVSDVAAAWKDAMGPSLHLVAADRDGRLLHQVVGRVPIRERGAGRLPAPGEDSRWAWQGFLSFAANPRTLDPPSGWLAVASHDIFLESDYQASMRFPADFEPAWRVRRIRELLSRNDKWSIAQGLELQTDVVSGRARGVLQLLGPEIAAAGGGAKLKALQEWNGAMRAELCAPSVYVSLLNRLADAVGSDEARMASLNVNPIDNTRLVRLLAGGIHERWWDDVGTTRIEGRADILSTVLSQIERSEFGTWGSQHYVVLRHPFERLPGLGRSAGRVLSRGPFQASGDETTVAGFACAGPLPTAVSMAPAVRFVTQPGFWDETVVVIAGGQSGRPWSPYYDNQIGPWLAGQAVTLAFDDSSVEAATVARLRLEPQ